MSYRDWKMQVNSFPIALQGYVNEYYMYCEEGNTEEMSKVISQIKTLVDNTKLTLDNMLDSYTDKSGM